MKNLAGFILIVATLGALGCHATFAPPARVAIGRMPEALGKGKVSIQAGAGAYGAEIRGAVGLSKGVELDFGATLGGWDKKEHLRRRWCCMRLQFYSASSLGAHRLSTPSRTAVLS